MCVYLSVFAECLICIQTVSYLDYPTSYSGVKQDKLHPLLLCKWIEYGWTEARLYLVLGALIVFLMLYKAMKS